MVKIFLRKWCLKNIWLTENNKVLILSSKKRKSTEFDLPQQMLGIIIQTVKMKLIVKVTIISVRMPLNLVLNSSIVMPPLSQSLYGVARFKFSKTWIILFINSRSCLKSWDINILDKKMVKTVAQIVIEKL